MMPDFIKQEVLVKGEVLIEKLKKNRLKLE